MILRILLFCTIPYGIYCKTCDFNVKIEQKLHNEGFHRNLTYYIKFASNDEEERSIYKDCDVGIEQTLPAGVYAGVDEMKEHSCKNSLKTVFITPVDIEGNAKDSSPIVLQIYSKVMDSISSFSIPVHARYHEPARGGGMAINKIPPPKLYLKCPHDNLFQCEDYTPEKHVNTFCNKEMSKELCKWQLVPAIMVTDTLIWEVPVGNLDHYYIVAWITSIVIILASLYLIKNLHEHNFKVESLIVDKTLHEIKKKKLK